MNSVEQEFLNALGMAVAVVEGKVAICHALVRMKESKKFLFLHGVEEVEEALKRIHFDSALSGIFMTHHWGDMENPGEIILKSLDKISFLSEYSDEFRRAFLRFTRADYCKEKCWMMIKQAYDEGRPEIRGHEELIQELLSVTPEEQKEKSEKELQESMALIQARRIPWSGERVIIRFKSNAPMPLD